MPLGSPIQVGSPLQTAPPDAPTISDTEVPGTSPSLSANAVSVGSVPMYEKPGLGVPPEASPSILQSYMTGLKKPTIGLDEEEDTAWRARPKTAMNKIAEEAGTGTVFGAPFGPIGAVAGAVSGGVGEAVKIASNSDLAGAAAGLISGFAIGPIVAKLTNAGIRTGKAIGEGVGLLPKSPVNDLYSDIGNTARIGGANDASNFWMQGQNALRSGVGGSERIVETEQKLFNAVQTKAGQIADELGPNLTRQELGEYVIHTAGRRAEQIRTEVDNMYNAMARFAPAEVVPQNYANALASITGKYQGADATRALFQQGFIGQASRALIDDIIAAPGAALPYNVIQNMRTDIGELISKGALNPNVNVKELRFLYRSLTADMEASFANTGNLHGARVFQTVNASAEHSFDLLERTMQQYVKLGLEPEMVVGRLLAQAKNGSTRIDDIATQLNNIDPTARSTIMGYVLRQFGQTQNHNFDPAIFYKNFQSLSPEARDLFPLAQREGIDRLSQLSGLVANSFEGANRSHTGDVSHFLDRLGTAVRALGAIGGGAMGAAGGVGGARVMADEAGPIGQGIGAIMGGVGGMKAGEAVAAIVLESAAQNALAKLWTNKAFNIWLGTEAPRLSDRHALAALGALAAQEPELNTAIQYLVNYMTGSQSQSKVPLQPGETGRKGFAEGGSVEENEEFQMAANTSRVPQGPGNSAIRDELNKKADRLEQLRIENELDPFLSFQRKLQEMNRKGMASGGPVNTYTDIEGEVRNLDNPSIMQMWLNNRPSYSEDDIPERTNQSTHDAMKAESDASIQRSFGLGRDAPLFNALNNPPREVGLASGGPIKPPRPSAWMSDPEVNRMQGVPGGTVPTEASGSLERFKENIGGTSIIDQVLSKVRTHESGNRPRIGWGETDLTNTPDDPNTGFPMWAGKPGPKGNSTAAGLYQITKQTWDPIAMKLGIKDFSEESQTKVAKELYRTRGTQPWAPNNAKLASALGDGSKGDTRPPSIINLFVQTTEEEAPEIDTHENTRTALLEGADPATQSIISSILGAKHA